MLHFKKIFALLIIISLGSGFSIFDLPENSYEAGHYLPIFMIGELSYTLSTEIFKLDEAPSIIIGNFVGVIFHKVIFKDHYNTTEENQIGATGLIHWNFFRITLCTFN